MQKNEGKYILKIVGLGKVGLTPAGRNIFRVDGVRPEANLEFFSDSPGRVGKFRWTQKASPIKWIRLSTNPQRAKGTPSRLSGYAGKYRMESNPYRTLRLSPDSGDLTPGMPHQTGNRSGLTVTMPGLPAIHLPSSNNGRYSVKKDGQTYKLNIGKDDLTLTGYPPVDFIKTSSTLPPISSRATGFTHADSLQGMLTPLRTCYDVLFYDLDIAVTPETRFIKGKTTIRWKTIHAFDRMQIDLFANMTIEKILFHGRELSYTREYNAVFIQFPGPVKEGGLDEIVITYAGHPREPEFDADKGGWFWLWDRDHTFWCETVTQGVGASCWWPCKDHLSDRPDSMKISVTFPTGLTEISNGRLLRTVDLPDGQTRRDWYVSYPVNTYDVVINIGNYTHYSDAYVDGDDTLGLHYYCMSYNLNIAKKIFSQSKDMLRLYKKIFGPYPFIKDGFALMESIYPMEHQGAISIGQIRQPSNPAGYDSAELVRLMWHESAHEWWGNNVGCKDYADLWIHEAFATYAEVMNYESVSGRAAALRYLHSEPPQNKEPIIGVYDVNNFHLGDMYAKGALMLHTLRSIIDNDTLWFSILRGIQERFRYNTVTTEDITGYISSIIGKDLSYFFDQYLRHASIPVLVLSLEEKDSSLQIRYKWEADGPGFCMPVKWTIAKGRSAFVYPQTDWQTMDLKGMRREDFRVDTDNFYIAVKELTLRR